MTSSADQVPVPPRYPEWERAVRPPVPLPPPKSCDCQAHIFGDIQDYPTQPHPAYIPPAASFDDLCAVERVLGFERFVVVHSWLYGADHRLMIDALEALPDRSHIRFIGRVDDTTGDAEIERLQALGCRGTLPQRILVDNPARLHGFG
jgi:2-pyrone-4,6-dicarboxylate lactonase